MFITNSFLSSRDTEKLKTPLYLSPRDAPKHASGELEKSIIKFDPMSELLILTHYVQILQNYPKYVESKFKKCFPNH